jgi:hypothetical protein
VDFLSEGHDLYLEVIGPKKSSLLGKFYPLKDKALIGFSSGSVKIPGDEIENPHCTIKIDEGIVSIVGHAKSSITKVAGKKIPSGRMILLEIGDKIQLGQVNFKLVLKDQSLEEKMSQKLDAAKLSVLSAGEAATQATAHMSQIKEASLDDLEELDQAAKGKKSFFSKIFKTKQERAQIKQAKLEAKKAIEEEKKKKLEEAKAKKDQKKNKKSEPKASKRSSKIDVQGGVSSTAWFPERLISNLCDLLIAINIFQYLMQFPWFVREFAKIETISLLEMAKNISQLKELPNLDPALVMGAMSVITLYFAHRFAMTLIFGVSLGQFVFGIRGTGGFLWNRIGGGLRVIIESLTSQFLIFDLPVLFRIRTLKEILTSTQLALQSKLMMIFGLVFITFMFVGMAIIPFGIDPSFNEAIEAKVYRVPKTKIKGELARISSNRYKLTTAVPRKKDFIVFPIFSITKKKSKSKIEPRISIYDFKRKVRGEFSTKKSFSLYGFIKAVTRGNFVYPLRYPKTMGYLVNGDFGKDNLKSIPVPVGAEIADMVRGSLKFSLGHLQDSIFSLEPFMFSGYLNGKKYLLEEFPSSAGVSADFITLGDTQFLRIYKSNPVFKGKSKLTSYFYYPLSALTSRVFEMKFPETKPGKKAESVFLHHFFNKAHFDFSKKLKEPDSLSPLTIVDKFAITKLNPAERKSIDDYTYQYFYNICTQVLSKSKEAEDEDDESFPGLRKDLEKSLMSLVNVNELMGKKLGSGREEFVNSVKQLQLAFSESNYEYFGIE